MQIGKRIFPYPVLNNAENYSGYKNSTYSLEYEDGEDGENYIIKNIKVVTTEPKLRQMLNDKTVKAVVVIECGTTVLKRVEEIGLNPKDIKIPLRDLNGQVEVSSFVYALEKLDNFHSNNFLEDYQNFKFNIDKYSIMAVDDGFTFKLEFDEQQDKKVSSIFSIIKSYNPELKTMKVYPEERKIKIELPENEFTKYDSLKCQDIFINIFFSIIVIPALCICLKDIQNEIKYQGKNVDDIREQYIWFASIQNAYKKIYGTDLTVEAYIQLDILDFSQNIMNTCTVLSISDFYDIISRTNKEEDD